MSQLSPPPSGLHQLAKSINFEFLHKDDPALATLGGFAEAYAHSDPSSALVKMRMFGEQVVELIYHKYGLAKPPVPNLNDLLNSASFKQVVPPVVSNVLHSLRQKGNKAAHGKFVDSRMALSCLQETHGLATWYYIAQRNGTQDNCPAFVAPQPGDGDETKKLKREKTQILKQMALQDAQIKELLENVEKAREAEQQAVATAEELQQALANNKRVATSLSFNEETTRNRLIDFELASAGWDIAHGLKSTAEVGKEISVMGQPTTSGEGFADYVLWGDGGESDGPLAVIEAKKTSVDPIRGQRQAELYAKGFEEKYGRRPLIYYTNGFEIWFWNDAEGEPARKVYGFHGKESLEQYQFRRTNRLPASEIVHTESIINRPYQIGAMKSIIEEFSKKRREALIVQATGTGKTRVAIALSKALIEAKWAKRILFLCDRRELRKQAKLAYQEHIPSEPLIYVTSKTSQEREHRIYLATYPAMDGCYESFDIGFFDLIIFDESHRSIYKKYLNLIRYFDALKVGLTATPVDFIHRNTYDIFGCEDENPTYAYELDTAITEGYLVPYQVKTFTTEFLREGIKYTELNRDQQIQLEEQVADAESVEFESTEVSKNVFNKPTETAILRNLMDNGLRDETGSLVGKTIVFARNHPHAVFLVKLFDELYPQHGGKVCRLIDTYEPRAEELIDEFKKEDSLFRIAISVDMLDTGIDVPSVVNLVFAKPVKSKVKFWQMIGRGTRLKENLFGEGKDKTKFLIFDHWGNFEYFDELGNDPGPDPGRTKSLLEILFEERIALADAALNAPQLDDFEMAISLIHADVLDLPDKAIPVKDCYREVEAARERDRLSQFSAATQASLQATIARLMENRATTGFHAAFKFDLLVARLQRTSINRSTSFENLQSQFLTQIDMLQMNLNQVRAKAETISRVKSDSFWDDVSVAALEEVRLQLRGIMQYVSKPTPPPGGTALVTNVAEDRDSFESGEFESTKMRSVSLEVYKQELKALLGDLFEENETLRKIRKGQSVTEDDLQHLNSLIHARNDKLDLNDLKEYYPDTAQPTDQLLRAIIGMDPEAVKQCFQHFVNRHKKMNSLQIKFLEMLQNHIAKYGCITIEQLYEDPFKMLAAEGIDGIFSDESQIDEVIEIVKLFPAPEGQ